jgi:N-methylhydantoinase A/oxoprolinase/acetone carboxylase beta subunit
VTPATVPPAAGVPAAGSPAAMPPAAGHGVSLQRAYIAGAWREVPAYERSSLVAGAAFPGPALVVEDHTATVVEADWTCCLDEAAALVLRRRSAGTSGPYPYT